MGVLTVIVWKFGLDMANGGLACLIMTLASGLYIVESIGLI
jgi:hypothetical protein